MAGQGRTAGATSAVDSPAAAHAAAADSPAGPAPTTATAAPAAAILLVVACALVDPDGRVLLARRPAGKPMAGLWEFPGGKVHPGETPEAALIRELREELGIGVEASCLAPFTFASHPLDGGRHLLMPLYLCRRWEGAVRAREGQALAWAFERLWDERPATELVALVDADCAASPNLLAAFDRVLRAGAPAAQAAYDVANPEASATSAARTA